MAKMGVVYAVVIAGDAVAVALGMAVVVGLAVAVALGVAVVVGLAVAIDG